MGIPTPIPTLTGNDRSLTLVIVRTTPDLSTDPPKRGQVSSKVVPEVIEQSSLNQRWSLGK